MSSTLHPRDDKDRARAFFIGTTSLKLENEQKMERRLKRVRKKKETSKKKIKDMILILKWNKCFFEQN